ncbi:Uncharacterised protein [Nocardia otitidiscaviarum]|uniref:Uncharacterized protein n=1 Tax=Nocardia otitidiscaviarum TaxID=1823 RepID=A0A378YR95_9NOCA|nr:hypothetical protein [Nocardia otitidiscaviarum]MBF6183395.1 hypothetical protein [Nocardia otitidiscaviarum]SUA79686.1 Uncharacterised protein [Nocardia otitidiscaviarum]
MSVDLAAELRRLETERHTGILRAGDGIFHLVSGAIAFADCRRTTGMDRLVVEAGVASADEWRRAEIGDPGSLLERPRLEALALLSVFDAAYFLLESTTTVDFRPAPPHWLAPVCRIAPRILVNECARRANRESGPWTPDLVDRVPVVPARHFRQRRVVLTSGAAEVLAAADARRSITAIARELGRTTYGCLAAVRDLSAVGLIEPPAAPVRAPLVMAESMVAEPAIGGPTPPLRRRVRQTPVISVPDRWEPVDRDVLIRLRAALEELA